MRGLTKFVNDHTESNHDHSILSSGKLRLLTMDSTPIDCVGTESLSIGFENLDSTEEPSGGLLPNPSMDIKKLPYCPVYLVNESEGKKYYRSLIVSGIETIEEYFILLETLRSMQEGDVIEIVIDSPGGLISTGATIATMIVNCKGLVITRAVGQCASAGSLIWSAGHKCLCGPMALFMYHMSSHFSWGNSVMIQQEAEEQVGFVKSVFLTISMKKGHITQEELDRICREPNQTVWISSEEMQKRVAAYEAAQAA